MKTNSSKCTKVSVRIFQLRKFMSSLLNPLNAELNPICHLLALLGAHHILHVSRIRVNYVYVLDLDLNSLPAHQV